MNIKIRQEQIFDYKLVDDLVEYAFRNVKESDHTEHLLVGRLRKSDAFIPELSLVAEVDERKIVGHILLTKVAIVSGNESVISLAVAPLSVLPEFQKQGIGGELRREAHKRALQLGYSSAVLLGHKDYYPRFGYKKASDFNIEFPFDVLEEYCMAIELFPGALDGVQGIVHYSDPFRI